jgi:hypothetical protein
MNKEFLDKVLLLEEQIEKLYSDFSNYEYFADNDALVRKALCASRLRFKLGEFCVVLDNEIKRRQGYKV